jgi:uncharacterized protein YsxB (DUF464 family)
MTTVSFNRIHDTYLFECTGHTGYSSCGRDILCSAVSVLCYTMRSYLEGLFDEGILCNFISEFSDGSALIRFELSDGADEGKVLEAVKAVLTGFSLLEENFPDFVTADV